MTTALTFNEVQFDVIPQNSQPWIRSPQIAVALGYARADRVNELYARHADEFGQDMTTVVTLPSEGGQQETRIFSLRGCHLLAMFARTPVAKSFRKWVLDVLDRMAAEESLRERNFALSQDADTLTPSEQAQLHAIVQAKVGMMPKEQRRTGFSEVWGRFNKHFQIARYAQLAPAKMGEAVEYLVGMEVKAGQKALPPVAAAPVSLPPIMDMLPGIPDEDNSSKAKRLKKVLRELHAMQDKCGGLIDEMRLCLSPGGRKMFLPEKLDNTYKTLQHLNLAATAGVYMTRQALISAYHIGKGIEFC